jgi:hypothetical protein
VLNVEIRRDDIEDSPLAFESGDRDGILMPTERGFVPMPWLADPSALLPLPCSGKGRLGARPQAAGDARLRGSVRSRARQPPSRHRPLHASISD